MAGLQAAAPLALQTRTSRPQIRLRVRPAGLGFRAAASFSGNDALRTVALASTRRTLSGRGRANCALSQNADCLFSITGMSICMKHWTGRRFQGPPC